MKDSWSEVKEVSRTYYLPNGNKVKINNPSAIFISKSRTHYVSNEDDTERLIVPWPFDYVDIVVENSNDWLCKTAQRLSESSRWLSNTVCSWWPLLV